MDLNQRLSVFTRAGLVDRVPTPWQLRQGEIEMTPYVISTDATAVEPYVGARFGHPVLRQPLIASQVGLDHFRTGSGLGAKTTSQCRHLHLTYHQGMPVFDLQVLQTHDDGLDVLERKTEELLDGSTREARRINRLASLCLAQPDEYHSQFLGDDGWIARARRFDYPDPSAEDSAFPPEFFSLVGLVNYCARSFPEKPSDIGLTKLPGHIVHLLSRRYRSGGGFGWWSWSKSARDAARVSR
jgi:hypothetical protein